MRLTVVAAVIDLYCCLTAFFQVDAAHNRHGLIPAAEGHGQRLIVDHQPSKPKATEAENKVARFLGGEESRPLHPEDLLAGDFCRQVRLCEVHVRLDTAENGSALR